MFETDFFPAYGPALEIHLVAVFVAILLTPFTILRPRRDRIHKIIGYVWISAMALTALSSFWLYDLAVIGSLGPIHILSVMVLFGLFGGVRHAMRGEIRQHQQAMRQTAFWGLGVAGLFTFFPDRLFNELLFPGWEWLGFILLLLSGGAYLIWARRPGGWLHDGAGVREAELSRAPRSDGAAHGIGKS